MILARARPVEEDMQTTIIPNLWFDTEAEEAAEFYTSVSPNSHMIGNIPLQEGSMRRRVW